ncbi:hypothetical protein [Variovorax sp. GT1P44]|uniref:hypothetical protein n=1 Tax=Variovorax sp. GT1P44 TaxID=3443742 RepID=UPI003F487C52
MRGIGRRNGSTSRADPHAALARLKPVTDKHRGELWITPSCSLVHIPSSQAVQASVEKLDELRIVAAML